MEFRVLYTKNALKSLKKLPKILSKRIIEKIKFYRLQEDPLSFAKKLTDLRFGEYRFRIGEYRVFFDVGKNYEFKILVILAVKHRKDSYK